MYKPSTLIPTSNGLTTRWCYSGSAVSLTVSGSHVIAPSSQQSWGIFGPVLWCALMLVNRSNGCPSNHRTFFRPSGGHCTVAWWGSTPCDLRTQVQKSSSSTRTVELPRPLSYCDHFQREHAAANIAWRKRRGMGMGMGEVVWGGGHRDGVPCRFGGEPRLVWGSGKCSQNWSELIYLPRQTIWTRKSEKCVCMCVCYYLHVWGTAALWRPNCWTLDD